MSLDDLAGRAAEQARADAAASGHLDPAAYRARRERRNQRRGLLVAGVFVVVALVVAILVSPPEEDIAAPTTTIPDFTTTTIPTSTTTTVGPQPSSAPLLGAGWEVLDAGPIAGRYRMAAVWTDYGLFVWGGHDGYSEETPGKPAFHLDGFIYEPDTAAWREVSPAPSNLCGGGESRVMWLGSVVFLHVPASPTGCAAGALYDPAADAWRPLEAGIFDAMDPRTPLVWTGEVLVAPTIGWAYDPSSGEQTAIPRVPGADAGSNSRLRTHWTGSAVLVDGSTDVYSWSPGQASWREVEGPPVPAIARDSVWTDNGLLVVNYQMATAFLDLETSEWARPGDLPLRFYECLPEALAVSGTPVVQMCSGIAIWDGMRAENVDPPFLGRFWVPIPLARYGDPDGGWGDLVAGDDEIFSVGGEELLRFRIGRDEDERIIPPTTLPIGVMFLDVPEGWELYGTFAPEQSSDGTIPEDETIGMSFVAAGPEEQPCDVSSTYSYPEWSAPEGFVHQGLVVVERPGRYSREGVLYRFTSPPSEWGGTGIAIIDENGSDVVFVMCEGYPDEARLAAESFASGLWSPWEGSTAPETPEVTVGTGWEELDRAAVAGRMRVAATWTGEEVFVWGGHDGYAQETPGTAAFYQGADLYDPQTGTWRPAGEVPDGLCPVSEASATWIGDAVLVHGDANELASGCLSSVATYDPVGDYWTVLQSTFFTRVPHDAQVVWTGEWLAAPAFGLAWVPGQGGGETIEIPVVPESGFRVGSPTMFHWDGERIVAVGAGDVYSLRPGDERWTHHVAIGIAQGGRRSVLTEHGLFVVTRDGEVARVVDLTEVNLGENLPLRLSECDAFLVAAGGLSVAEVGCSGMAIWDPVRGFWVPIPMDVLSGWAWQPTVVGTDHAVYSIGEKVLRYPISHHPDFGVVDPPTIPVGVMQLDLAPRAFNIRTTIGVSQVFWPEPDDWVGEVIAIALDAPGGLCHVTSTYSGPSIGDPIDVLSVPRVARDWPVPRPERPPLEVLDYTEEGDPMTDWVVGTNGTYGDRVGIQCESRDDALLLAMGLWLPGE
jgi:hypothetical protein